MGGIASRKKVYEIQMVAASNYDHVWVCPQIPVSVSSSVSLCIFFPLVNEAIMCIMEWFRQGIGT